MVVALVKAAEEAPPAPPARIARRTSASVKSVDVNVEAPQTPPPVPTSRPPIRRPTSPPIITALPVIVPAPATDEDAEQGELLSLWAVNLRWQQLMGVLIGRVLGC